MPFVGILQAAGLAKESVVGTLVTPPTEFLPMIAPDSFSEAIELLESKGIRAQPDAVIKVSQGPASLKGGKVKIECEPENCGNLFMAALGADTFVETPSFVVTSSNQHIDFKEDAGSQLHASIATGTFLMGTTSATVGSLCAAIKTALQAVGTGTYTVTYSDTTKKLTITDGGASTDIQILFSTGTNAATSARDLLGFSHADTSSAVALTSDLTTQTPIFTHTFTRVSAAQLPTYSWWFDKGAKFFQFVGCMMSKLVIDVKAKEFVTLDTDWTALAYDDTGSSQAPVYSHLQPFVFNNAVVNIDGSPVADYENVQMTIDNMVEADPSLAGTIYPTKIYSKGMKVTFSMTLYLENTTQYQKFLAGTSAHVNLVLTSSQKPNGSNVPYSLTIDAPVVNYNAAPLMIESGILKINFTGTAVFDTVTGKTISVALANTKSASF